MASRGICQRVQAAHARSAGGGERMTRQDTDFAALLEPVARTLWGEPNKQLSRPNDLRWGRNGSGSRDLDKGAWYDHERQEGGGVLELVKREVGINGSGVQWLRDNGFIPAERPKKKPKRWPISTYDYVDEN